MNHLDTFLAENQVPENQVTTREQLEALIARVKAAQQKFAGYSQKQVDQSSAAPRWPPPMPASRWPRWPWKRPGWA